ncbi:YncE family protein [Streptomyces sp. NPDC088350]|uniref:YncE family protein n=1 Tax=Streptomyces sp. NPDC088350 TaxID=3365854 RepID=UPI0037F75E45
MRLKQVSLTAAISLVAGLTTAAVGLTGPAARADSTAALPLSHYAHLLVDTAHQHLFFSQGAGSADIVVTDLAGNPVTTLTGEQGATGLALSPDGGTLYAALADGDAVAAIDTATLTESARYPTGTGSAPVSVAAAGGKVWYGYTADGGGGIGAVDPAAADPAPTPQPGMASWAVAPVLAAGGGVLAAEEPQQDLSHVATFDVSSGTATAKADTDVYGGTATGFQVTSDGTEVLLAAAQARALHAYRTSDLASAVPSVYYTGSVGPASLTVDTDGTLAVGSTAGLYLYAGSIHAERHFTFSSGTVLAPDGLEWGVGGSTLYAVVQHSAGDYSLDVLSAPKLSGTTLTLTPPNRAYPTAQFTFTGSLATLGFMPAGASLQVTRDGVALPDVTVGADGTFSVTDTRQEASVPEYQVSYAGDATHSPATATLAVHVYRLSTGMTSPEIDSATPRSVVLKSTLISEGGLGSLPQGTTVAVSRTNEDTQETVRLPSVTVDPATTEFTVTDAPGVAGRFTYQLYYAGDTTHGLTADDPTVQVDPYTPALTLKAPATATRATALTFGGTLGDTPYTAGEKVTVSRTDAAHTTTPVTWTVPVGTDGKITVKDTPSTGGANTYTVAYPGDASHQPVTASAIVQVSRAATAVSVTSNTSTYTYGATATVTAHLGRTYNSRTVSIYATPAGGRKTLVKTAAVDSGGNLRATYKVTRNTTFTASFAGDYRYAPATATHAVHGQVDIAETLGSYYTSTKYGTVTYRVYHHTVKPQVAGTVTPDKSGQCMRFQAQEYYAGAWHTLTTSSCFSMAPGSVGVTHLSLTNAVGQKFRVRTEYVAGTTDTTNVSTWGGWLYLTVRT